MDKKLELNEFDLAQMSSHISMLKEKLKMKLPEDIKASLTEEIEFWEKKINE